MNRKDIMIQIKSDLEDNLTTANSYAIQPVVVKQGVHMWNDFKGRMPSVHFTIINDEPYEDEFPSTYSDNDSARVINIIFYGYATTSGAGDSETIYDMSTDIENFLLSEHFSYADNILLGKMEILEGGVSSPICAFNLETRIIYS